MICPYCYKENARTNLFCGSCGKKFSESDTRDRQLEEHLTKISKGIIDDQIAELTKEAQHIEYQALLEFQEKIQQWTKNRLSIVGVIVSILIGVLSFFGIKEYRDLRRTIEEARLEIENKQLVIDSIMQEQIIQFDSRIQEQLGLIDTTIEFIAVTLSEMEEKQKRLDELTAVQNRTKGLLSEVETSRREVMRLKHNYVAESDNIKKLQNSMFEIFIHCPGNESDLTRSRELNEFIAILTNEGFVINEANIGNIGVNQSEIIYYNKTSENQAYMIRAILRDSMNIVVPQPHHIFRKERNPKEMLIKLQLAEQ